MQLESSTYGLHMMFHVEHSKVAICAWRGRLGEQDASQWDVPRETAPALMPLTRRAWAIRDVFHASTSTLAGMVQQLHRDADLHTAGLLGTAAELYVRDMFHVKQPG